MELVQLPFIQILTTCFTKLSNENLLKVTNRHDTLITINHVLFYFFQNGVIFGPLAIMPWVVMSGYFLQLRDSPYWSRPFFKISYFRHGLEGLVTAIYGYSRPSLPCISEDYCHYVSPKKFLKELDMAEVSYLTNVAVILGIYATLKILTYFVLIYQLRHKR